MKIIAFIDGSHYTQSVLDHAAWVAKTVGASVELVHVIGRRDTETPMDWSGNLELGARSALLNELAEHDAQRARLAQERGRLLLDTAGETLRQSGIETVHAKLRRGDLVDAVRELEAEADLIVIGKRGEAADFAKLHLGSNLERVARVSHKPVMVASRAFAPVERFMIAYDGGKSADKAVDHVAVGRLFVGLDCHLVMAGKPSAEHRVKLDRARDTLAGAGYAVTAVLEDAEPEKLIADQVIAKSIGCLVMGAYGHSRIRTLVVGSTTTEAIRSAKIPVMLFR